ncbi:MAG TPA: hypothetical protein VH540_11790 [Ktedonobacterales bacterium]|jgi:hypothetical protein
MPKAVRVLLQVIAGILMLPGPFLLLAFPIVLAVNFPTQATVAFLALALVASGLIMMAWGIRSWLRTSPRTRYTLVHRSPELWAGLVAFAVGCLLGLFKWSQHFLEVFSVLASIFVSVLLFIGWLMPVVWEIKRNQRAQQAQAPAQENAPARRRDSPFLVAWTLFTSALGYALFVLTRNGQLAAFLALSLSYQPPFGPIPFWVFSVSVAACWAYALLIHVPAPLRRQPPRQRFLFLLARRVFGVVVLFEYIFSALELSHRLPEEVGDLLFPTLVTLGAIAGMTYLAAWAVVWLSRWRTARNNTHPI